MRGEKTGAAAKTRRPARKQPRARKKSMPVKARTLARARAVAVPPRARTTAKARANAGPTASQWTTSTKLVLHQLGGRPDRPPSSIFFQNHYASKSFYWVHGLRGRHRAAHTALPSHLRKKAIRRL